MPFKDKDRARAYHRAYKHKWNKTHPPKGVARAKDIARSYAGVYKRRGRLTPQPCACGCVEVEMHHENYAKPLEVLWLCHPCHMAQHRKA